MRLPLAAHGVLVAVCFVISAGGKLCAQITPQQAVQDARSVPRPDPRTILTPGNAANSVPQYGADVSAQSNLYQGGSGQLIPPGMSRLGACMVATDPECIAVQLVATGKATRPSFTINPTDPLISGGVNIVKDPNPIVGPTPGGIQPGFQTCTTTNQTTPATYIDETCDIVTPDLENTCYVTRDIQVDADANYRCETSPNRLQTYSCNKTLQVDVQSTFTANCTTHVPIAPLIPGGNTPGIGGCDFDFAPIYVQCNTGDANLTFQQFYQFQGGGGGNWVQSVNLSASEVWVPLCAPIRIQQVTPCDLNGDGCVYRFDVMRLCTLVSDGDGNQTWWCGLNQCGSGGTPSCGVPLIQYLGDWYFNEAGVVSAAFTKPQIQLTYVVTDNWINGCAALEGRQ